jgi:acyl-CoA thioesterase
VMHRMYSRDGTLVASCVQEVSFIWSVDADDERQC